MRLIIQPNDALRLGDFLRTHLRDQKWSGFKAAVAFAKRSGTKHIRDDLTAFCKRASAMLAIGVDCNGTSREGLEDLISAAGETGQVFVFHNELESTFHPKLYLFKNDREAIVAVGSGNLTQGGLFTNYEASIVAALKLSRAEDAAFLQEVELAIGKWMDPEDPTTRRLDPALLQSLVKHGLVLPEARTRGFGDEPRERAGAGPGRREEVEVLFARVAVQRAPLTTTGPFQPAVVVEADRPSEEFVMTLRQTDVGYGQTTRGTSRRSPEIFIPLAARDYAPRFWGWPDLFNESPTKWDRQGVLMKVGTRVVAVNMMVWKRKRDLRLRSEAIRSAASVGDILRLTQADETTTGYSYHVEIIPQGTPAYDTHLALCDNAVRNSEKRWGYC